jgi:hypothetical protein
MNKYLIKSYEADVDGLIEEVVLADSVFVDGSVANFSVHVTRNEGKPEEYLDYESVASIDISKMFFIRVADKSQNKKTTK